MRREIALDTESFPRRILLRSIPYSQTGSCYISSKCIVWTEMASLAAPWRKEHILWLSWIIHPSPNSKLNLCDLFFLLPSCINGSWVFFSCFIILISIWKTLLSGAPEWSLPCEQRRRTTSWNFYREKIQSSLQVPEYCLRRWMFSWLSPRATSGFHQPSSASHFTSCSCPVDSPACVQLQGNPGVACKGIIPELMRLETCRCPKPYSHGIRLEYINNATEGLDFKVMTPSP